MRLRRPNQRSEPGLAELAALADGSLPSDRRLPLEERVAASPELAAVLAEQERALAIVRAAAVEVEAPSGLHRRIELARGSRSGRGGRRLVVIAAGAAAAAATALALVLSLPNGAGGPAVAEAAVLATRPASSGAPAVLPGRTTLLRTRVETVPFPNLARKFGWRPSGQRVDLLQGRRVVTVFYLKAGTRIGYSIVSGTKLEVPEDAGATSRRGVELRTLRIGPRSIVTWLRKGHTCILSGSGVEPATLLELASWTGRGTIPF